MKKALALAAVLLVASALSVGAQAIEDFDSYVGPFANGTIMFRQPSFSGSTSSQLDLADANNNISQVVAGPAQSNPNSLKAVWKWKDDPVGSWLRFTTFSAASRPNPAIDYTKWLVFDVLYTSGDPLGVALGTRDNGTAAAIGADGGSGGAIEWIGASGGTTAAGPITTQQISAMSGWQTIVIKIPEEPVAGFTGNGILDFTTGTIEHLAFVRTGSTGPVELYLDNFRMVPEPGSLIALGAGLAGFAGMLLRRKA